MKRVYQYLDLCCGHGNSIKFSRGFFGPGSAVGIDRDSAMVKWADEGGYDFYQGDVTEDVYPELKARVGIVSHALEHMPNEIDARKVLHRAYSLCDEFVFVCNPAFDACGFLAGHGLKFYWADMKDHTFRITTTWMNNVMRDNGWRYTLYSTHHAKTSSDLDIQALDAPVGLNHYKVGEHPPKPYMEFATGSVPKMMTLFVWKDESRRERIEHEYMKKGNYKVGYV